MAKTTKPIPSPDDEAVSANDTGVPAVMAKTGEQYIAEGVAELTKISKTDQGIAELKEKYEALQCASIEDRPTYFAIVEGYKHVKSLRLEVERKRKELNEFPLAYQRSINAEAKRITELIQPIEFHLNSQRQMFEDAEAAAKAADESRKREALTSAGFKFDGMSYVCGMHVIPAGSVSQLEDDQITFYQSEAAKIREQEQAAEARKAEEKAELERLRLENEQKAADIAKQMAKLQKMKDEIEASRNPKPEPTPEPTPEPEQPAPVESATEKALPFAAPSHMAAMNLVDLNEFATGPAKSFSTEYMDGFEHCREAVLRIFADPTPRTRSQFVEAVKAVKP